MFGGSGASEGARLVDEMTLRIVLSSRRDGSWLVRGLALFWIFRRLAPSLSTIQSRMLLTATRQQETAVRG